VDVDRMREHCLALPGAWPDFPWDHEYPVIKVGPGERGKIFAFLGADTVGVKGGPSREAADEWLDRFPGDATVMRYIGRSGWNTLALGGAIPDEDLLDAVDGSYRLVVAKLPSRLRPPGADAPPPG
jgi:predicted DNA-binding protein (MmcQ/YjbR family)